MLVLSSKDCLTFSNYYFQNSKETNEQMASNSRKRPKKRQNFSDSESEGDGKWNILLSNIPFL